jgi:hypothetical protein
MAPGRLLTEELTDADLGRPAEGHGSGYALPRTVQDHEGAGDRPATDALDRGPIGAQFRTLELALPPPTAQREIDQHIGGGAGDQASQWIPAPGVLMLMHEHRGQFLAVQCPGNPTGDVDARPNQTGAERHGAVPGEAEDALYAGTPCGVRQLGGDRRARQGSQGL